MPALPQDSSPRLSLPWLMPAQAQKHVTHNEALERLDILVMCVLQASAAETPPGSPEEGQLWGLGPAPTGAWAGQGGRMAAFQGGGWLFFDPAPGWQAWDAGAGAARRHDGTAWVDPLTGTSPEGLDGLGIGTSPDGVNRLAVAGAATLLTHGGAGHQVKVNKAAPAETASLLYQTNWSGRAEMGLAGGDDFSLKVSADGSAWTEALAADRTSGQVSLPQGAVISGSITGTAVMQSATDAMAGRLMTTGGFGLGVGAGLTPPAVTLANGVVPGLFAYYSSDPAAPSGNSGAVLVQRYATNFVMQWARPLGGWLSFTRYSTDGGATWSDWSQTYGQKTVLGAVSQSGGTPTGALMEAGSNTNGSYLRLADGTQICRHVLTASAGAATGWTYPAAFAAAPAVTGTVEATVLAALCLDAAPGATSASLSVRGADDARRADTVHLSALGRWF